MLLTNILKLKKPEGTDPVDVQDFNDNADVLDTAIGDKVSKTGDIANTTISSFTPSTASYPIPVAGDTAKISFGKIKKFCEDIRNTATGACYIGQIVNNCVTNNAKLPLSAAQGKVLMDLYTQLNSDYQGLYAKVIDLKNSDLKIYLSWKNITVTGNSLYTLDDISTIPGIIKASIPVISTVSVNGNGVTIRKNMHISTQFYINSPITQSIEIIIYYLYI